MIGSNQITVWIHEEDQLIHLYSIKDSSTELLNTEDALALIQALSKCANFLISTEDNYVKKMNKMTHEANNLLQKISRFDQLHLEAEKEEE